MNIVLDVITVFVLVYGILSGYRKGFISSIIDFFSTIAAFVAAYLLSGSLGGVLNSKFVTPALNGLIMRYLENLASTGSGSDTVTAIAELAETMPDALRGFVERFGVSAEKVIGSMAEGGDAASAVENAVSTISAPIAGAVSGAVAFMIIFAGTLLVLSLVKMLLGGLFSLPLLNTANKLAGLLFGFIKGVFMMFIIAAVSKAILPGIEAVSGSSVGLGAADTLVFRYFYNLDLFAGFMARFTGP